MTRDKLLEYFSQHYIPKRELLPRLPLGSDPNELWLEIQNRRKARSAQIPIHNAKGVPCWFVTTDRMIAASETIVEEFMASEDAEYTGMNYGAAPALAPLEEVFYTSYVEGSPMEMKAAMEFLQGDREPSDVEEQMIINNRSALAFASSNLYHPVDGELMKMLTLILTQNMEGGGREYRTADWLDVPSMMGEPYDLPAAALIPDRVSEISAFLADPSVHPLIKAAVAQAWTLMIRPFPEGNERLARILSNVILVRAGYAFFGEVSLSAMIAKNGYPYYNAMANTLRTENGGDLTYFLEYYIVLLSQAVEERRNRKKSAAEEAQKAERQLAGNPLKPAITEAETPHSGAQQPQIPSGTHTEQFSTEGYVALLDNNDEAEGNAAKAPVLSEGEPQALEGGEICWSGAAKARKKLQALMHSQGSLIPVAAEVMLRYLSQGQYVFSADDLKKDTGFKGKQTLNLIYSLREKGVLESVGRSESNALYTFCCDELSEADYSPEMLTALCELAEGTQSLKDKRIVSALQKCLVRGFITAEDYEQAGDGSRWQDDMKLAEQMGFVRRLSKERCIIMRSAQPCFERLDSGQKKRARLMYDSFGEGTFSLDMVVATLDYSSSTASAYLHQFTLLRILDCRKEDVNVYQFLVNPREHPEVFEDAA